jgi:hypothetical protein
VAVAEPPNNVPAAEELLVFVPNNVPAELLVEPNKPPLAEGVEVEAPKSVPAEDWVFAAVSKRRG